MPSYGDYPDNRPENKGWKRDLYDIIFEAETPAAKDFDLLLIITILASVFVVMLDSVASIRIGHGQLLHNLEWFFTIIFTIEYFLRIICVRNKVRYTTSFFGIVDLVAIIPTYLSLFLPGA